MTQLRTVANQSKQREGAQDPATSILKYARQSGWGAVLPHLAMFPRDLLLPHLFCSLARGAKKPVSQLVVITSAPMSRSVLDRALAKPTDR